MHAVVRLINDLHTLDTGGMERRRLLLREICGLIRGKCAMVSFVHDDLPGWRFQPIPCTDYGWSPDDLAAISTYRVKDLARDPTMRDPMDRLLALPGRVQTLRRDDLPGPRRSWYRSPNVNEIRRASHIDDCICSMHRLPTPGWAAVVGVHRAWGDRTGFTPRDRDLLHFINQHLTWLWEQDVRAAREDENLSPRLRQTLHLLMAGLSEKEAARKLLVSPRTLHKYVTALYRRFGVSSRAELLVERLQRKNLR
jgi:DNA-binding CsgD family transcriptional regulator